MASWDVYLPKTNKSAYSIHSATFEQGRNKLGLFKIVLRSQDEYEYSNYTAGYTSSSVVYIRRDGVTHFKGIIENVSPQGENGMDLVIEGRSLEILLALNNVTPGSFKVAGAIPNILTNKTSKQMAVYLLDTFSEYVTYTGTSLTASASSYTMRFSNENLLSAISAVSELEDQDFWVDYDETADAFYMYIGTQGRGTSIDPVQIFANGKGMTAMANETGLRDTFNRIRILGKGDGFNQVTLAVPFWNPHKGSLQATCTGAADADRICQPVRTGCTGTSGADPGCVHAGATAAQATNGVIEYIHSDARIDTVQGALDKAIGLLDLYATTQTAIDVQAMDYEIEVSIGDWVLIKDDTTNTIVRVHEIRRTYQAGQIEELKVAVNRPFDESSDEFNVQKRNFDISQGHETGATNIFPVNATDNTEGVSFPLTAKFYLPTDVKTVNDAKLSYNLAAFRDYSATTASGGSSSPTSAAGSIGAVQFSDAASASLVVIGTGWTNAGATYTPTANTWLTVVEGSFDFGSLLHRHVENTAASYTQNANTAYTDPTTFRLLYIRVYNSTDGVYYPDSAGVQYEIGADCGFTIVMPANTNGKTLQLQAKVDVAQALTIFRTFYGIGTHTHDVTIAAHSHTNNYGIHEDVWPAFPPAGAYTSDSDTELLLHLDNNVTDSSSYARTVTNTDVTFSTSPVKYGTHCGSFNGTTSKLSVTGALAEGKTNVCWEAWIYPTSLAAKLPIFDFFKTGVVQDAKIYVNTNGSIGVRYSNAEQFTTATGLIVINTWYHVLFDCGPNGCTLYLDGNVVGTDATAWSNYTTGNTFLIGADTEAAPDLFFAGYIDDVRLSSTLRGKTVKVVINGTDRTSALAIVDADDQTNLDISTYLTIGTTNTVLIYVQTANTSAVRARVATDIYIRCYIESK